MTGFDRATQALAEGVEAGLRRAAELVLEESNRRVPTEGGDLEQSGKVSVDGLTAAVSYDTPYAVMQHENQNLSHDSGREAKFLENAGNSLHGEIAATVAAEIRRTLGT